jgi:capsular polysaccharide biosynthesis protein
MTRSSERYPDPPGFLEAVRRSWWIILGTITIGGILALVYVLEVRPTYEARTTLLVGGSGDAAAIRSAADLAPTYTALASSEVVLARTISDLGLSETPAELRSRVQAAVEGRKRILTIKVRDSGAARSAQIARTLAGALIREVATEGEPADGSTSVDLDVLDQAGARGARIQPIATFSVGAGLFAGALVGAAIAFARGSGSGGRRQDRALRAGRFGSAEPAGLNGRE